MKANIQKLMNRLLRPVGLKLHRLTENRPLMEDALIRAARKGFGIRTVIDIGAAAGHWSVMALPHFPEARFLAIEPLKERLGELESIKARQTRFDYVFCVAGEEDGGTVRLNVTPDLDGSTVGGLGGEMRAVPVRSLDALIAEKRLEGPLLVKFDTHGYELPILRGATETLARTAVIVMEVYNFQFVPQALRFHQMCAHLEDLGFRPFDLANPSYRKGDHAFWQMDLFFASAEHPIFAKTSYR